MTAVRFFIVNLGCKVNRVESDGFERLLRAHACAPAPQSEADLVVVNTCTVTGEAEKKTRKAVRHALKVNDRASVVVTGCASAIAPEEFTSMGDRVTVVPKADMALHLERVLVGAPGAAACKAAPVPEVGAGGPAQADLSDDAQLFSSRTRVGVKVQDGCDNACTYCIVHVARGRATSRPKADIVGEVVALAHAGVREVVLSGINIGSYRHEGDRLADLLKALLAATADVHAAGEKPMRFRVSSIEPMDVHDDFIELLAGANGRICRHLHLPLQSGSSKVLRDMARPYDAQDFCRLVDYLYAMVPALALTTDVIVGFPGETDEDFQDTCDVARACRFTKMHVFPYSRRAGTPAAARADQVAPEVKATRAEHLRALSDELRASDRAARAGTQELALVEEGGRAMTESYYELAAPTHASAGSLVSVTL